MASTNKKTAEPKLSKYITGEEIEISREELQNAPYNPRKISKTAKKRLKKNIQQVGLLGGIVWNRTTGNIVSGHQRVQALDALERKSDYKLRVTVVEMDEKTEKEQNVFMNNPEAQGDFDMVTLEQLMGDEEIDVTKMGFDEADKFRLFGFDSLDTDEAVNMAQELRKSRDLFDKIKDKNLQRDADDFYCVIVFADNESRRELARRLGVGDHRYFDGRRLFELLDGVEAEG